MKKVAIIGMVLWVSSISLAQEGEIPEIQQRERGIPRELVVPEGEANTQEGTEEGLPSLRSEPQGQRSSPYWLPPERRHWKLGVYAHYTDTGAIVTRVLPGSAAQEVGLERGDRLVTVNGFQIGWVADQLFPLDAELQRQAGRSGYVWLLVQNVRTNQLINLDVHLRRQGASFRDRPDRFRSSEVPGVSPPDVQRERGDQQDRQGEKN